MKLKKQTASFVGFSDIRDINGDTKAALEVLNTSSSKWSYGDNNRTLIDIDSFLDELGATLDGEDGFYSKDNAGDEDEPVGICIEDLIEWVATCSDWNSAWS